VPVVETVAVQPSGARELVAAIDARCAALETGASPAVQPRAAAHSVVIAPVMVPAQSSAEIEATQREARRILRAADYLEPLRARALARLDAVVMNPIAGPLLLAVLLFAVFQAVFSWAVLPMAWINAGMACAGQRCGARDAAGALRSLLVDGVIAGAGSVLVFLPQILILFFFILLLEDSGYLPRAAFLLDNLMGKVGLSGRAFIPLLSSFACAIPGIMATRTIAELEATASHHHDRAADDLLGAAAGVRAADRRLHPERSSAGSTCAAWCCSGCTTSAAYSARCVAWVIKRVAAQGLPSADAGAAGIPLAEPAQPRNSGLWERTRIFITRVGTIIFALMIVLWFLSSFPAPPPAPPARRSSTASPACSAARCSTCSRRSASTGRSRSRWCRDWPRARWRWARWARCIRCRPAAHVDVATRPRCSRKLESATALSLLAWYVFAPQCLSTLATVRARPIPGAIR
jgi:ferrous iron transport protein B